MSNTLKYVGVAVVAGLLVVAGYTVKKPTTIVERIDGTKTVTETSLGALSGPDIPYPYFSFGGVRRFAGGTSLQTATNTVCAIQSPVATSTLISGGITMSGSTTASVVTLARSNSSAASTTLIGADYTLAANTGVEIAASSSDMIFAPNRWFTVSVKGGSGTFSPTGYCHAVWETFTY